MFERIACIGGATLDRQLRPLGDLRLGTSNPVRAEAWAGGAARNVAEADAYDYVAGYMNCNDVSARDLQFRPGDQWVRGSSDERLDVPAFLSCFRWETSRRAGTWECDAR